MMGCDFRWGDLITPEEVTLEWRLNVVWVGAVSGQEGERCVSSI